MSNDKTITLGDTTYGLPGIQFHGRRSDGVFVEVVLDPLGDGNSDALWQEIRKEAARLRADGHRVGILKETMR